MHHVMLDLETLDTSPTAVVTAIGAVIFDPYSNRIGDTFYRVTTDWSDQQKKGRTINGDTVAWWLEQSREAQQALIEPKTRESGPTFSVIRELTEFFGEVTGQDIELWGNGADFDNVILGSLFLSYGVARPWSYSKNRCFRTIRATQTPSGIVLPARLGTHHNALDDAMTQVLTLQAINQANRAKAAA